MNSGYSEFINKASDKSRIYCEACADTSVREMAGEYLLPDYLPDIDKILCVRPLAHLSGSGIGDGVITWEGDVFYTLLYMTGDGKLAGAVFAEPFSGSSPAEVTGDECMAGVYPSAESVTVKPLNARKVQIKSTLRVRCTAFCEQELETVVTGRQSVEDTIGIESLKENVSTLDMRGGEEKGVIISEDIELEGSCPSVKELITCSVSVLPPEARARNGEAEVEFDALFDCVYECESGGFSSIQKRFRVSRAIPAAGLEPSCECVARADAGVIKASVQNNSYGERRIIEIDFPCDITVTGYFNREAAITADMYSTDYETVSDVKPIQPVRFCRVCSGNVSVNASAARENTGLDDAKSVFDGNIVLGDIIVTRQPDSRRIVVEGSALITVVAVCGDEDTRYCSGSFTYPFRFELDAGDDSPNSGLTEELCILSRRFRLDSTNVYADFEIGARIIATDKRETTCVGSLAIDREHPFDHDSSAIILYYPEKGETIWDISKKYHVSRAEVENANPNAETAGVLLIPKKNKKTPTFSRVIG